MNIEQVNAAIAEADADQRLASLRRVFREEDGWPRNPEPVRRPTLKSVEDFAVLVDRCDREEECQVFLEHHPDIILGFCSWAQDGVLAFLEKPRFSAQWIPDFATFAVSQGGSYLTLVEIERPGLRIFNADLSFTKDFRKAEQQVLQWAQDIDRDRVRFINDAFRLALKSPVWPNCSAGSSFLCRPAEEAVKAWDEFGGREIPAIRYVIIASAWDSMNAEERRRFVYLNTTDRRYDVFTYHQMIRYAYLRSIGFGETF